MSDFFSECKSENSTISSNCAAANLISHVEGKFNEYFENPTKEASIVVLLPHEASNIKKDFDAPKRNGEPDTALRFKKLSKVCAQRISVINVYSAAATVVVVTLLLLCFVTTRASHSLKEVKKFYKVETFLSCENDTSAKGTLIEDWNFVENLGSKQQVIHFTVGTENQVHPKGLIHDGALRISGRPSFCYPFSNQNLNAPKHLRFLNVTQVHLSEMEDCHYYTELILTKWHFPSVRQIKLQKMLVRKQEFLGLISFIDRHNQTLRKVEIDECYICPSPDCDVGMIDFPSHDFQLIIIRRRESPKMVLG
ncbi:hypothetical protein Ocin01_12950 [Orchesella cincta]|uniref:Uncharacterized protein n=1 Tax=Orchesella cincta TaxID=48709 RepID=A0A1D2ML80_ORCCI|nr:hypothetical protein Ocin01_12950 [Orchesella cincta]